MWWWVGGWLCWWVVVVTGSVGSGGGSGGRKCAIYLSQPKTIDVQNTQRGSARAFIQIYLFLFNKSWWCCVVYIYMDMAWLWRNIKSGQKDAENENKCIFSGV